MASTPHPLFTDREVDYIRRSPLLAATLAQQYGVDIAYIRAIRDDEDPTHRATCSTCGVVWDCRCAPGVADRGRCLFDQGLCDPCQLARLDA